jgi:hypothetical protein
MGVLSAATVNNAFGLTAPELKSPYARYPMKYERWLGFDEKHDGKPTFIGLEVDEGFKEDYVYCNGTLDSDSSTTSQGSSFEDIERSPLLSSRKNEDDAYDSGQQMTTGRLNGPSLSLLCRRVFLAGSCVLLLWASSVTIAIVAGIALPFSNSNFILATPVIRIEITPTIRFMSRLRGKEYSEKFYWNKLRTEFGVFDCQFDMERIFAKGGMSRLYKGTCYVNEEHKNSHLS